MTKEIFARNGSWMLEVIRDKCELTQAETDYLDCLIEVLEQEPCEDAISRQAVLDMAEDMTDQFGNKHRVVTEGLISMLPPVTPKPKTDVLDKIRTEIETDLSHFCFDDWGNETTEWKEVKAIIDKYKAESEE